MADAVVLLLSCGHGQELPARVDVEVSYCYRCRELVKIFSQHDQWRIKCLDCRYGRAFGAGKYAAQRAADKHCRERTHRVQVLEGSRVDGVRTLQMFMNELPMRLDDAPF